MTERAVDITVRLSGFLKRQGLPSGHTGGPLRLPEGATLGDALDRLGVAERAPYLVTLNGARAERHELLHERDVVVIIPPISGGQ